MSGIWRKLNLKDQKAVVVVNAPSSFAAAIESLSGVRVTREAGAASDVQFLLAFVTQRVEIANLAADLAPRAQGDPVVWFAYPKGSSKSYACDFNRDAGWQPLGDAGFEGVRQVAIDEDWSAIRFRRVENIKTMKRSRKRRASLPLRFHLDAEAVGESVIVVEKRRHLDDVVDRRVVEADRPQRLHVR